MTTTTRTATKSILFTLALSLLALSAAAQTEYAIEQPLGSTVNRIDIDRGWNVQLVRDTVNMVVILSPCEYYFAEGNEPQICRLQPDGKLEVWQNTTMPQGTTLEVHLRDSIRRLTLQPFATATADCLLMGTGASSSANAEFNVRKRATLNARQVLSNSNLQITADSGATVHISALQCQGRVKASSERGTTLLVDQLDCNELRYRRDPKAIDNLPETDTALHYKTRTASNLLNFNQAYIHLKAHFSTISPSVNLYNSPYNTTIGGEYGIGLHTNHIPIRNSSHWGASFGMDFIGSYNVLTNNVSVKNRQLQLDQPTNNRYQSISYMTFSLPVRIHYTPSISWWYLSSDLFVGLTPGINFMQSLDALDINSQGKTHTTHEKVRALNTFQLRAEVGYKFTPWGGIEISTFFDILPTYRNIPGMKPIHNFGLRFSL